jgi:dihydroorotate dehydrogenase electron transfer subunit
MMRQGQFIVEDNRRIAKNTHELRLSGDTSAITAPGQFVNIRLDGFYLRRPMSIADATDNGFTIIYKVIGEGTFALANIQTGAKLDILTGLGNGFDIAVAPQSPVLVGGGAGIPPLYYAAKKLIEIGKAPTAILGFNSADEFFYIDEFRALGIDVTVTSREPVDGAITGFIIDALPANAYVITCGPEAMLRAVYDRAADGQFSFESRMGCGFGACLCCTCKTKYGAKRICVDGPVLTKEAIVW